MTIKRDPAQVLTTFDRALAEGRRVLELPKDDQRAYIAAWYAQQEWYKKLFEMFRALWGPGCDAIFALNDAWGIPGPGMGNGFTPAPLPERIAHFNQVHAAMAGVVRRLADEIANGRREV